MGLFDPAGDRRTVSCQLCFGCLCERDSVKYSNHYFQCAGEEPNVSNRFCGDNLKETIARLQAEGWDATGTEVELKSAAYLAGQQFADMIDDGEDDEPDQEPHIVGG